MSTAMEKAIELVTKATDADNDKKYVEALPLYEHAIDYFLHVLKYEAHGEQSRERVRSKCAMYLERAEQLKKYLLKKGVISPSHGGGLQRGAGRSDISGSGAVVVVEEPNIHWDDIAGLHTPKKVLLETAILPRKFPHLFKAGHECRKPCRGILLYGPSGTGKSHLAKAVATEAKSTLLIVNSGNFLTKCLTSSENLVKELFELARKNKPAIMYMDQIECLGVARAFNELDNHIIRVKSEFLTQVQALDNEILVLGATKSPWHLDSVLLSMFEKRIYIPLPDESARFQMFQIHNKSLKTTLNDDEYHTVAAKTEGYSGADIGRLVREAVQMPIRKVQTATHFKIVSGPSPSDPTLHRDDLLMPCSPADKGATEMSLMNVPSDRLVEPPMVMEDFIRAIRNTQPSVSSADLEEFQEWIRNYGQES